jgi:hypothetical protein
MKITESKLLIMTSVVAIMLVFALALVSPAAAQDAKDKAAPTKAKAAGKAEVVKEKAKDGKGTDPNVKSESAKNDPKGEMEPPPNKGGKGGRGFGAGWCNVNAANYTRFFAKIFVDGSYRGTIGPFDTGTVTVGTGATTFYARADFEDGTYKYWGSYLFNCSYGHSVTWQMGY